MEVKQVKVLMPSEWTPRGTYTLQELASMHLYVSEKQKKFSEAEKNKTKLEVFSIDNINEIFKYDEVKLENPKKTLANYYIDNRSRDIAEAGKVVILLGITDNCKVIQMQYPSPADQYGQYTDTIYSYLHANPERIGLAKKIAEIPPVVSPSVATDDKGKKPETQ